jgi:FkbM family methyltransferase
MAHADHGPPEVRPGSVTVAAERRLPKALDLLAKAAFGVSRLEPVPGWYFGQWNRRDPRAWMRRVVWRIARARNYDGPVTTSWYFGLRFNHHFSGDISQCTYVDARYEPNEMYAMSKLIGPGMCVVDVGANEGIFTLMAAKLVGANGTVHAFEPSPRERDRLLANLAVNRLSNVKLHAEALGRAAGTAVLQVAGAEHPGHNTIGGFAYAETAEYALEVQVTTLDEIAETDKLTRLDLLKIDVEGSETATLQGAEAALRKFRPVIVAEAQEASLRQLGSSVSELLELLRELDYEVKVFGPSGTADTLVDDQLTGTNLLCLPKGPPRPGPSRDR